ncbi:MAG: hypothetical protein ACJ8AD_20635 [Gemmatimonadaceae bacterium]|jgi:hypothetical protein
MSERNRTHNGRDVDGRFKVRQADVDDLETDPSGVDFIRDDVRLGGAVADVGAQAGERAAHIHELVEENRENVNKISGKGANGGRKRSR